MVISDQSMRKIQRHHCHNDNFALLKTQKKLITSHLKLLIVEIFRDQKQFLEKSLSLRGGGGKIIIISMFHFCQ